MVHQPGNPAAGSPASVDDCYTRFAKLFEAASKHAATTLLESPNEAALRKTIADVHSMFELEIREQRKWLNETDPSKN